MSGLELAALHSKAVDYVKTGEPAEMPKRLRPRKWPHFMEKKFKPKDATYHSNKILGQLYDKVETVNFVPQYEENFDKRILRAYSLDDAIMKKARQLKTKYDVHMKRIMAQQEIKTEFEIWSTFVLSRPRVGSDYKVQEEIARLSDSLKEQFRNECIEKAEGKEFDKLGPFVAAMYKVTKEEMDIALAECHSTKMVNGTAVPRRKLEPKYMPLISFPWLFEKELGRIATGIDASDDLEDLGLANLVLGEPGRKRQGRGGAAPINDFVTIEDGVTVHRGQELNLFDVDDDNDADVSDLDESQVVRDENGLAIGKSGEVVLATEFQFPDTPIPEHLRSGTGVEDVMPRLQMDGFLDPRQGARDSHDLVGLESYFGADQKPASQSAILTSTADINPDSHSPEPSAIASGPGSRPRSALDDLAELSDEVEEEVVELEIKESSLEQLARMVNDNPASESSPASISDQPEEEVEEEVVEIEVKESSLDKLNRMMSS